MIQENNSEYGQTGEIETDNLGNQKPIDFFLAHLHKYRSYHRGYTAHCPAHNDKNASLMIWEDETDGHVGVKCHAGCSRKSICDVLSIKEEELYIKSGKYNPSYLKRKIDIMDIAIHKGIHPQLLTNLGVIEGYTWVTRKGRNWRGVLRITYYNLDGSEYSRARIRTALIKDSDFPIFYWEGPDEDPIIPYGLEQLQQVTQYLVIVEGESDVWTLRQYNIPSLGIPGAENAGCLQAEHVTLFPPEVFIIKEPRTDPSKPDAGRRFVTNLTNRMKDLGYQGEIITVDLHSSHDVKDPNALNQKLMNEGRMPDFKIEFQEALDRARIDSYNAVPRPEIIVGEQDYIIRDSALESMLEADKSDPSIFSQLSGLSRVCRHKDESPAIQPMGIHEIRNKLTDAADYYRMKEDKKTGELVKVNAPVPKGLAELILAMEPNKRPFPPLDAIVETPVIRTDGSLLRKPGYDPETRLYYAPAKGLEKCNVPENPTRQELEAAVELLMYALGDFPYEGQADFANTMAALITPFIRHIIKDDVQLGVFDATNPGTGKGLLISFICILVTGLRAIALTAPDNDEEWDKRIIAKLMSGSTIIVVDNLPGKLESSKLEAVLTARIYEGRILGRSQMAKVANRASWYATGNNVSIRGDLPRRCYRIRLIAKTANPEERTDFKIKDLMGWTEEHRCELIVAVLTLIRAWYAAGKPQPKKVPNLGTFTEWAVTVGGILEYAGIEGFQANREELRTESNKDATEWEGFLLQWEKALGNKWVSTKELDEAIQGIPGSMQPPAENLFEMLPGYLKEKLSLKPQSFKVVLGKSLEKRVQTAFGRESIRIERKIDAHTKQPKLRVVRGVAGVYSPTPYRKTVLYNNETLINNSYIDGVTEPPQPPAEDSAKISQNGSTPSVSLHQAELDFAGGCKNEDEDMEERVI